MTQHSTVWQVTHLREERTPTDWHVSGCVADSTVWVDSAEIPLMARTEGFVMPS